MIRDLKGWLSVSLNSRLAGRRTSFWSSRAKAEGSRGVTFKLAQRDPSQPSHKATARQATSARDDRRRENQREGAGVTAFGQAVIESLLIII
jgi:hypothetical protein